MVHAIEFHGRLCRADQPPAEPGLYDLDFRLHPSADAQATLWRDEVRAIAVKRGGYYHVVLGHGNALHPDLFDGSPRYLSVRLSRGSSATDEVSDRVPVLGLVLRVADAVAQVEARVTALESSVALPRDAVARRRVRILRRRILRVELGEGGLVALSERLSAVEARLARLDGEAGRIGRIEDELEDLVGADGDVVDLDARLCRLEGVATPGDMDRLAILERRFGELEARLKRR